MNSQDQDFENLLNYLNCSRGIDLTGYKRNSLKRLTSKRMQRVDVASYSEYLDYLQVHPQEHENLFNSLMLNVTAFFRDRSTWDFLREKIIPRILKQKDEDEPIRFWSAGCASGEEAYSLAIVLSETLGVEQFCQRVKIYATDFDEEAINQGRKAFYPAKSLEVIPEDWQRKYFEPKGYGYIFDNTVRRCVIFGKHDLLEDAPISKLDLLCCRNTLIYFNSETQAKILNRFHFALNPSGFLFVGKAEMLLAQSSLFAPVDNKNRVFIRLAQANWRDRLVLMSAGGNIQASKMLTINLRLRDETFAASPIAQIVLDKSNHQACSLFDLNAQNIGNLFSELELSRQSPQLQLAINRVCEKPYRSAIANLELKTTQSEQNFFDVQITPLMEGETKILGINISFIDVTVYHNLRREIDRYSRELVAVQEELQTSNEELDTTNEELQSTNEELDTTNEELQSTNQELETMNEELQSFNEELQTSNEELSVRTEELNNASIFMESIFTSLKMGVTVLDYHLKVQLWNNRMSETWGLHIDEARDRFFFDLDIGLPLEQLQSIVLACQTEKNDYQEITLEAINRRGKAIDCRVVCTPLRIPGQQQGVVLLMEVYEK